MGRRLHGGNDNSRNTIIRDILFIAIFFIIVAAITIIPVLLFKNSQSMENLTYAIYGTLYYVGIGSVSWVLIFFFIPISMKYALFIRFLMGLFVLNILVFFAEGFLPSFDLLEFNFQGPTYFESLNIHFFYLIAFLSGCLAYFPFGKKEFAR
ncbi:hypothetical protein ABIB62_004623 [Mucilaginibacter sp. UYP25]|uniref:hypothetical protein n=1 Tax=unclassified Mucilaginibacter TaxID=2617802 RepID=UPI003399315A